MSNQAKHKLYMHMDKELHDKLKEVAEIEHRSISAQIHIMLQEALDLRKAKSQA